MSDTMKVQPFSVLLDWILKELEQNESIFGIPRSLFYTPAPDNPYATEDMFGHYLTTPIGPAAGPHTQLAQNIIASWLSGGRFIELKTVQIMDELEIPRPCIDMEDEGYNVEWSQELKLDESAHEYINAWALIHILRRVLGFEGQVPFGTIFNMSVGYNLEGIQSPPMQRFMDRMEDASAELAKIQAVVRRQFPQFSDVEIPSRLTNSVTLSTMHGCPPDEIESISRYLLVERGFHTFVKLNPTLLGKDAVLRILHEDLGYRAIHIPDSVFEHDLRYDRAVELIKALKETAAKQGLTFGVKLSNTLAMANHRDALPGDEMYMSGRALYPITINLFHKLAQEFDGDLNVSYAGGADALNTVPILAAGALPVTAASDLLKPGGYSRFLQALDNLQAEMHARNLSSLGELARDRLANLEQAAAEALQDRRYKKSYFPYGLPKVESGLDLFDCVVAPCTEQCAVCQDVPEYAWLIAQGEYDRALEVILSRNPLPGVTGYVCTELCRTRCTRNDYDEAVAIRALKRFANEQGRVAISPAPETGKRVAVIGAGPSGLSAAFFLALNGVQVTVFEAEDVPGGMTRMVPVFRLPWEIIQGDVDRIAALGVEIKLSHPITGPPEKLLHDGYDAVHDAVYVASGFQKDTHLQIEGIAGPGGPAQGVYAALDLLERVRRGERPDLGSKALVIGGGDTAMDATRVARRLTGNPVTVVYRRTKKEMPASEEEFEGAFEEGNDLHELASPIRVIVEDGRVAGLECMRNELGEPDQSGRRRPIPVEGSEFLLDADSVIVAIGQSPDLGFLDDSAVSRHKWGAIAVDRETGLAGVPGVYAGGDVVDGPESIIAACADGRRAAEAICAQLGIPFQPLPSRPARLTETEILDVRRMRARKEARRRPAMIPPAQRDGFELIEATLTEEGARAEALRCVQCTTLCDKCVEVCPNRANFSYRVSPVRLMVPELAYQDGELLVVGQEPFSIEQDRQIIHVDDFCNECGNCSTFCVHQGEPYAEKPRLFLKERDFLLEKDNAFYIEGSIIRRREEGRESRLLIRDGALVFENANMQITLTPDLGVQEIAPKDKFEGTFSLKEAAEMAVLLEGIKASATYLLVQS
jgi:putative selenate reductase